MGQWYRSSYLQSRTDYWHQYIYPHLANIKPHTFFVHEFYFCKNKQTNKQTKKQTKNSVVSYVLNVLVISVIPVWQYSQKIHWEIIHSLNQFIFSIPVDNNDHVPGTLQGLMCKIKAIKAYIIHTHTPKNSPNYFLLYTWLHACCRNLVTVNIASTYLITSRLLYVYSHCLLRNE